MNPPGQTALPPGSARALTPAPAPARRRPPTARRGSGWPAAARPLLVLLWAWAWAWAGPGWSPARADDLETLKGVRYHDVRVCQAEPDGLVIMHREGICKLSFNELSDHYRRSYGYDPAKAAAYAAQRDAAQGEKIRAEQKLLEEADRRRAQRAAQAQAAGTAAAAGAYSFSVQAERYGLEQATRRATAAVADQTVAWKRRQAAKADPTIWNERYWKRLPGLITPHDPTKPTDFDRFFVPNYLLKDYAPVIPPEASAAR